MQIISGEKRKPLQLGVSVNMNSWNITQLLILYSICRETSHFKVPLELCVHFLWTDINLNGVSAIPVDVTAKDASIQKIVTFVENIEKTNKEAKLKHDHASRFDRACFWGYVCLDVIYVSCVIGITRTDFCKINNLDFWI